MTEKIQEIAAIIESPAVDSTTFKRHNDTYYVSSAKIEHTNWHLFSVVRGPDVLFRSTDIFGGIVRISIIAILMTATLGGAAYIQLLWSKKKVEDYHNEIIREKKGIEFLSYHDALTGLYNRHYLNKMMTKYHAEDCLPLSVIVADVNGLKITNDVYWKKDVFRHPFCVKFSILF